MLDRVAQVTKTGEATATLRHTMVERQLRPFDVTDVPLLERFVETPREIFLPDLLASLAYSDMAISVKGASGRKRNLLPPLVLARMLQSADVRAKDRVLDIGGVGYSSALLSGLADKVVALECDSGLAACAKAGLAALGCENVQFELGPLEKGFAGGAPYDVIIIQGRVQAGPRGVVRTADARWSAAGDRHAGAARRPAGRALRAPGRPCGGRTAVVLGDGAGARWLRTGARLQPLAPPFRLNRVPSVAFGVSSLRLIAAVEWRARRRARIG